MLQVILKAKNRWEVFQKRIANTNQNEFRVEKVTKKKGDKLYVKWIVLLTVGLIKKTKYKWMNIFQNRKSESWVRYV